MDVPFELHVALRYLLAKRKQAFISVISLISTLGVTVGVMAARDRARSHDRPAGELRDRILGSNPHIFVWKLGGIGDYRAEVDALRRDAACHRSGAGDPRQGPRVGGGGPGVRRAERHRPRVEPQVTDIAGAMRVRRLDAISSRHDRRCIRRHPARAGSRDTARCRRSATRCRCSRRRAC